MASRRNIMNQFPKDKTEQFNLISKVMETLQYDYSPLYPSTSSIIRYLRKKVGMKLSTQNLLAVQSTRKEVIKYINDEWR